MFKKINYEAIKLVSGALLFANISCANLPAVNTNSQNSYSLSSTPDKGTVLNVELSKKCRKIAEYVLNKKNRPAQNLLGFVDLFEVNNKTYMLSVNPRGNYSIIELIIDTKEDHVMMTDYGLDGICNFGIVSDADSDDDLIFFDFKEPSRGLEHKEFYQSKFSAALDEIVKFYAIPILADK